jgi:hypothetical protein
MKHLERATLFMTAIILTALIVLRIGGFAP